MFDASSYHRICCYTCTSYSFPTIEYSNQGLCTLLLLHTPYPERQPLQRYKAASACTFEAASCCCATFPLPLKQRRRCIVHGRSHLRGCGGECRRLDLAAHLASICSTPVPVPNPFLNEVKHRHTFSVHYDVSLHTADIQLQRAVFVVIRNKLQTYCIIPHQGH